MNYKKIFHNELGAAAVEFAVVLLPLLTLVMGAIEFGTIFFNKQMITNASREAARAGIVSAPKLTTSSAITDVSKRYLRQNKSNLTTLPTLLIRYKAATGNVNEVFTPLPTPCANFQDPLTVTINYRYEYLFLNSIPGIADFVDLSASTTMLCE